MIKNIFLAVSILLIAVNAWSAPCTTTQFNPFTGKLDYCEAATAGTVTGTGTQNYLSKWATSSTLSNSLIFDDGTNVGLGTTAPQSKLTVGSTGQFQLGSTGTVTAGLWNGTVIAFGFGGTGLNSASDDTVMVSNGSAWQAKAVSDCQDSTGNHLNYTASSNSFSCGTSSSATGTINSGTTNAIPRYISSTTIDDDGVTFVNDGTNIGIGTSVPIRKLDVSGSGSGTTLTTASTATVGISNTNTTDNSFADVTWLTQDAGGLVTLGAKISTIFTSHSAGAVSGTMVFLTKSVGTVSEKMRIKHDGNVGIGTSFPQQILHIHKDQDDLTESLLWNASNSTNARTGTYTQAANNLTFIQATAPLFTAVTAWQSAGIVGFNNGPLIITAISASGKIIFQTGGSATSNFRMTVASDGNVGIGTTVPQASFAVGSTGQYQVSAAGAETVVGIANSGAYTQSNSSINSFTGNVGIGSSVPQTKLEVAGTTQMTGFKLTTSPSSGYILTSDSVGVGTWQPAGAGSGSGTVNSGVTNSVPHYTASTTLDDASGSLWDTGNVGIGTSVPSGRLAIWGNGTTTGMTQVWRDSSGTFKAAILDNGNVGIGSTLPTQLLDVAGTIRSTVAGTSFFNGNVGIGTSTPNNKLIVFGGNVGIGTTNPGTPLSIVGTSTVLQKLSGANTACATTCAGFACFFGEDTGILGTLLDCADATSDVCFCSKN